METFKGLPGKISEFHFADHFDKLEYKYQGKSYNQQANVFVRE